MAITLGAARGNAAAASTSATSYGSSVATQPADHDVVVFAVTNTIASGTPGTPAITGWGWTASLITTKTDAAQKRSSILWATGTGASNGTYAVDFSGVSQSGCNATAISFIGSNYTTPVSQHTLIASGGTSAMTATFASAPVSTSAIFATFGLSNNNTVTAGSGYTVLATLAAGNAQRLTTIYKLPSSGQTGADGTFTSSPAEILAFELAVALASGSAQIAPSYLRRRMAGGQ